MMRNFILIICTLIVFFTSCQQPLEQQKKPLTKLHKPELKKNDLIGKPILAAKKLQKASLFFGNIITIISSYIKILMHQA